MFAKEKKLVDGALKKFLPKDNSVLSRAMRYSVFAGGKRFRPALMLKAAQMLNGRIKDILPAAAAVEMIHTFTLIHDDLPCMDNSDLRRGSPTCHKKFGEEIALLAGDALNTLAFNIIAEEPEAVRELSGALLEVVKGQVLDLEAEGKKVPLSKLEQIHLKKTAALIKASVKIAAVLSGAGRKEVNALSEYGRQMGLAFQIADDILDFVSTPEILGKPTGADQTLQKSTYPVLLGIERSKAKAFFHYNKAVGQLELFKKRSGPLKEIADFAVRRLT